MLRQQEINEGYNHGVLFYQNPTHKHQVIFNLLKDGLEQGRGIFYVASDEPPEKINQAMLDFGFDIKTLKREGKMTIENFDRWYIVDGKFNLPNLKMSWHRMWDETLERGLKGLCACGEMGCFFQYNLVKELIEYERKIGKHFKLPVNAVCAYNLQSLWRFEPKQIFDLIRSHNQVFSPSFSGLFDFENFYYHLISEKLETVVGKICARAILSFLSEWRPLLDEDLEEEPKDLHTALESFIGPRAKRIEEKVLLKISEEFGLYSFPSDYNF
jgi:hypothetical protein